MIVKASSLRAIVIPGYIDGMEQGKFGDVARFPVAPEWQVDRWFNTGEPLELAALRGRIVFAVAFQMLCPGCVAEALPQAQRAAASFAAADLAVIGLHTVFEHHAAQGTPEALAAFLHEYRIGFPVAIDAHIGGRGADHAYPVADRPAGAAAAQPFRASRRYAAGRGHRDADRGKRGASAARHGYARGGVPGVSG